MKYVKQFAIILLISFVGELLNYFISLPVPASIYGLLIMLFCLKFKVIKVSDVKNASSFLIEIMPMMFIPAAAGLVNSWAEIKPQLLPYVAITVVSIVVVMAVSGRVTQAVMERGKKGE